MAGRVNHRGWIVLESIQSADGGYCVDFFEDPAGGHGFEHFRSGAEDSGSWTVVGGFGSHRYGSALEAADMALEAVVWLSQEAKAQQSWRGWRNHLEGGPSRSR